jgi:hypothetical protein
MFLNCCSKYVIRSFRHFYSDKSSRKFSILGSKNNDFSKYNFYFNIGAFITIHHIFLLLGWEFQIQIYTAIYTCICISLAGIHLFFFFCFSYLCHPVYKMENMKYRLIYEYEFHLGTSAAEMARRFNHVYGGCIININSH